MVMAGPTADSTANVGQGSNAPGRAERIRQARENAIYQIRDARDQLRGLIAAQEAELNRLRTEIARHKAGMNIPGAPPAGYSSPGGGAQPIVGGGGVTGTYAEGGMVPRFDSGGFVGQVRVVNAPNSRPTYEVWNGTRWEYAGFDPVQAQRHGEAVAGYAATAGQPAAPAAPALLNPRAELSLGLLPAPPQTLTTTRPEGRAGEIMEGGPVGGNVRPGNRAEEMAEPRRGPLLQLGVPDAYSGLTLGSSGVRPPGSGSTQHPGGDRSYLEEPRSTGYDPAQVAGMEGARPQGRGVTAPTAARPPVAPPATPYVAPAVPIMPAYEPPVDVPADMPQGPSMADGISAAGTAIGNAMGSGVSYLGLPPPPGAGRGQWIEAGGSQVWSPHQGNVVDMSQSQPQGNVVQFPQQNAAPAVEGRYDRFGKTAAGNQVLQPGMDPWNDWWAEHPEAAAAMGFPDVPQRRAMGGQVNALMGEGGNGQGGYKREVVIDPRAIALGLVREVSSPTAVNAAPGTFVIPTPPHLDALVSQLPDVQGLPAKKQGEKFVAGGMKMAQGGMLPELPAAPKRRKGRK